MEAVCPACRRELAEEDPIFCPHCGHRVGAGAEADFGDTARESLGDYEEEVTVPRQERPRADGEGTGGEGTGGEGTGGEGTGGEGTGGEGTGGDGAAAGDGEGAEPGARRTAVMSGAADPELSAARFGPARPPVAVDEPEAPIDQVGVHRMPGTPVRIPISPRPGRIVLGLVLTGFAAWLLLAFLPARRPLDDREVADLSKRLPAREVRALAAERLDPELWVSGIAGGIALLCFGLFIAVAGAVYRAQGETLCRKCGRQVIGWKRPFGLQCPLERHYASLNWALVLVTVLFWIVVLTLGGGLAILLLA